MLQSGTRRRPSKNRCANLRWKSMYIGGAAFDSESEVENDSAMWCQRTYQCVGPDGQVVDDFECSPARECYEKL